jgi:hypothetical protein
MPHYDSFHVLTEFYQDEHSSARYAVTYIRIVFRCFSFIHRIDNFITGKKGSVTFNFAEDLTQNFHVYV